MPNVFVQALHDIKCAWKICSTSDVLILNLSRYPMQITESQLLTLTKQWVLSYLLGKDINNLTNWTRKKKGSLEKSSVPERE